MKRKNNSKRKVFQKEGKSDLTQNPHHGESFDPITETLRYMANEAVVVDELFELWRMRKGIGYDPEWDRICSEAREKRRQKQRVIRLREKEMIKIEKKEGKMLARLSQEGERELLKRTMKERPRLGFDQECLVVYDFPTTARAGRDAFRNFLKQSGFEQVQKSVWKSTRDVFKDVLGFVEKANIHDWVKIYIARLP